MLPRTSPSILQRRSRGGWERGRAALQPAFVLVQSRTAPWWAPPTIAAPRPAGGLRCRWRDWNSIVPPVFFFLDNQARLYDHSHPVRRCWSFCLSTCCGKIYELSLRDLVFQLPLMSFQTHELRLDKLFRKTWRQVQEWAADASQGLASHSRQRQPSSLWAPLKSEGYWSGTLQTTYANRWHWARGYCYAVSFSSTWFQQEPSLYMQGERGLGLELGSHSFFFSTSKLKSELTVAIINASFVAH